MTVIEDILTMTFLSTKFVKKGKKEKVEKYITELEERNGELPPRYVPEMKCWTEKGYGPVDCTEDLSLEELESLVRFFNRKIRERNIKRVSNPSSEVTK